MTEVLTSARKKCLLVSLLKQSLPDSFHSSQVTTLLPRRRNQASPYAEVAYSDLMRCFCDRLSQKRSFFSVNCNRCCIITSLCLLGESSVLCD
jgi:hypothetical protein